MSVAVAPDLMRPLRTSEYERLVDLGVFEGERIELLYGVLVRMTPHGPPHDSAIQRLNGLLVRAVGDRAAVRIQSALAATDGSQPEPDVALVPPGDYDEAHPTMALLVIEVAQSSLAVDRGLKAGLYAECGVPEYWVVNLVDRVIEVRTQVVDGSYKGFVAYSVPDTVQLLCFPDVQLRVSDIIR